MPYHQTYTKTTFNQFIIDLSAFALANGWTIDHDAVYNTSYRRLHIHKGNIHCEFYSDANYLNGLPCTGYASGSAPNSQPGSASHVKNFCLAATVSYHFVSTVGCLYIGTVNATGAITWGGLWSIQQKIGGWADGFGLDHSVNYDCMFNPGAYQNPYYGQMYYNGAWTVAGVAAGGLWGNNSAQSPNLHSKMPNYYNAGIMPIPILMGILMPTDTSKCSPMGFAPGLFRCCGGNIYNVADTLTIGSDTYLIMPRGFSAIGTDDYLFKLGA